MDVYVKKAAFFLRKRVFEHSLVREEIFFWQHISGGTELYIQNGTEMAGTERKFLFGKMSPLLSAQESCALDPNSKKCRISAEPEPDLAHSRLLICKSEHSSEFAHFKILLNYKILQNAFVFSNWSETIIFITDYSHSIALTWH